MKMQKILRKRTYVRCQIERTSMLLQRLGLVKAVGGKGWMPPRLNVGRNSFLEKNEPALLLSNLMRVREYVYALVAP